MGLRVIVVATCLGCGARTGIDVPTASDAGTDADGITEPDAAVVQNMCPVVTLSSAPADPVGVPMQLALGSEHTCVRSGTEVFCWGNDRNGELGDGLTQARGRPVRVASLPPVDDIVASESFDVCQGRRDAHTCARLLDGTISCWGSNVEGSCSGAEPTFVPTNIAGLSDVKNLAVSGYESCAVLAGGATRCWGCLANVSGDGMTTIAGLDGVEKVGVGEGFMCALLSNGTVTCVSDTFDAYGNPVPSVPVQVATLSGVIDISVAWDHACALRTDGSVTCWGSNSHGQLGDGNVGAGLSLQQPYVPVTSLLANVIQVAAGQGMTCAIVGGGDVYCWGANASGALGIGAASGDFPLPTHLPSLANAVEIAAGWRHACARLADGTVWCWGENSSGQVGDGTTTARSSPVRAL
jgi:alpha-tubulin suppressor-like RCC1 family protein